MKKEGVAAMQDVEKRYGFDKYEKNDYVKMMLKEFTKYDKKLSKIANYEKMQKEVMDTSPFVIMFQQTEVAALRKNVDKFVLGPSFDNNLVTATTKE